MSRQRFEGRNLEEALENAARGLGVERYQLAYWVMMEKRGFLGGVKRVVIEADVTDAQAPPGAALDAVEEDDSQAVMLSRMENRPPESRDSRDSRGPRRRGRRDDQGRGGRDREARPEAKRRDGQVVDEPAPDQGSESPAATEVRQWCEKLVDLSGLDLEIRTTETHEQLTVRFYGPDSRLLLARGGELLDSIQTITNKAVGGRSMDKPIEVDCSRFKEQRALELGERARELADRVRRDGREQMLPAMNPVERRIIHLALHDDAEVTTESRGEGFYKRVAIVPRRSEQAG